MQPHNRILHKMKIPKTIKLEVDEGEKETWAKNILKHVFRKKNQNPRKLKWKLLESPALLLLNWLPPQMRAFGFILFLSLFVDP